MNRACALPGLDVANYPRHPVHLNECIWVEKNCYVDIWIEVLHAYGLEPMAVMPFVVGIDFVGDQWTFFKPPHGEIFELYGLDVQELNVWRPLLSHVQEHLRAGRMVSTEADAFWLPDTAGTDYRQTHTKTTIVINELDLDGGRMRYFHSAGYFEMDGEDFRQTFRLDAAPDPTFMPLYAESICAQRRKALPPMALAQLSQSLWRRHLARVPSTNPVQRFEERLRADTPLLLQEGLGHYHAWAFATIRQLGAAFELAAMSAQWLAANAPLSPPAQSASASAAAHFSGIASECKTMILKMARAVNAKRDPAMGETLQRLAQHWEQGLADMATALA